MVVKRLKLIVFGLDYTLWPFWVDTDALAPFKRGSSGEIIDAVGDIIACYPEVPQILRTLQQKGYNLAVVAGTGERVMDLFDWNRYITYREIYPGRKAAHFDNLQMKSGISLQYMLYFDNNQRNIEDSRDCGVTSMLVRNGINAQVIEDGLDRYEREH